MGLSFDCRCRHFPRLLHSGVDAAVISFVFLLRNNKKTNKEDFMTKKKPFPTLETVSLFARKNIIYLYAYFNNIYLIKAYVR